jgi:cell division protein FtsB
MQKNRKLTILITFIIVLFIFIVIGIIYEYVILNNLTKQLEENKQNLSYYKSQTQYILTQIENVQTDEYIENWARSELNWVKENEIKFEY